MYRIQGHQQGIVFTVSKDEERGLLVPIVAGFVPPLLQILQVCPDSLIIVSLPLT